MEKYTFKNTDHLHRFSAKSETHKNIANHVMMNQFTVDGLWIVNTEKALHIPQGYHCTIMADLDFHCNEVFDNAQEVDDFKAETEMDTRETKLARLCNIIKDGKFEMNSDILTISKDYSIRFFEDRGMYSVISIIDGRDFYLFTSEEEKKLAEAYAEYNATVQQRIKENMFMSRNF